MNPLAIKAATREGAGKRALITGLRGFTGYYLKQALEEAGYEVYGTVLPREAAGDRMFAVDLLDHASVTEITAMVRPDVVVHLAGIAFVGHGDASQIYQVNVVGARNLLAGLASCGHRPSCVLMASSANVYGNASVRVIDELVAPAPANDYAVSKLAMEYMARLWMDKLPIVIVRPFNYTGRGQRESFLLPKIVAHFRKGAHEIELGNTAISRDFSDVRAIVSCYRRLLATAPAGEIFNVCSGRSHSLDSVLEMMEAIAGYRIEVRVNSAYVRANDVLTLVGDDAKLSRVIGPTEQIPLAETLRWMYQA
ncbi:MAG: GDP-mannose 4,6-dehydratase [Telluria sp.]